MKQKEDARMGETRWAIKGSFIQEKVRRLLSWLNIPPQHSLNVQMYVLASLLTWPFGCNKQPIYFTDYSKRSSSLLLYLDRLKFVLQTKCSFTARPWNYFNVMKLHYGLEGGAVGSCGRTEATLASPDISELGDVRFHFVIVVFRTREDPRCHFNIRNSEMTVVVKTKKMCR